MQDDIVLKRKIDDFLLAWKNNPDKKPLIIKGLRQIGKSYSVELFGENHYENFVSINFLLDKRFSTIFDSGNDVDTILENITFIDNKKDFIPNKTLIFFDEIQAVPNLATCLKSFKQDGRYDVICSGSLMGPNYNEIESVSLGYKTDYMMYPLDFEEFLWAKGFKESQIEKIYDKMLNIIPLTKTEFEVLLSSFDEYLVLGGMPEVIKQFIRKKGFTNILDIQKQIIKGHEEDIYTHARGLDSTKILNFYNKIPVFLGEENKKFRITKIAKGAREREYIGVLEWLKEAGIVNPCYLLERLELPLKVNYNPSNYKVYHSDTGLLVARLDDEASKDLRENKNFNIYKGALYENIVASMLRKLGFDLFFYKNRKGTIEMDFIIRKKDNIIPVEVKATNQASKSLNNLITNSTYRNIKYGIKLCRKNIGFNGKFYTFPYFLTFLLKKFLDDKFK